MTGRWLPAMRCRALQTSWCLAKHSSKNFQLCEFWGASFHSRSWMQVPHDSILPDGSCGRGETKCLARFPSNKIVLALHGPQHRGTGCSFSLEYRGRGIQKIPSHLLLPKNAWPLVEASLITHSKAFSSEADVGSRKLEARTSTSEGPLSAYKQLVHEGNLQAGDPAQESAAARLQRLHEELAATHNPRPSWRRHLEPLQRLAGRHKYASAAPRGVYLYGGVGTGKTLMMDVFYKGAPTTKKQRVHFHSFMLDMHSRLHNLQHSYAVKLRRKDPIALVAEQLSNEYQLLCIDEIEVTDIADALILLRLFTVLWPRGMVLVATSNSAPEQLYRNGLNRHLFEPFFNLLRKYTDVICLDKGKDYREGHARLDLFIQPLSEDADLAMEEAFKSLTDGAEAQPAEVAVMMGRKLQVPLASGHVARFDFHDICGKALGAADYLALAHKYQAIFIDRIPWLGEPARENMARRLVNLIDILYENGRILFCSATVPLDQLFLGDIPEQPGIAANEETRNRTDETAMPRSVNMSVSDEGGSSGRSTTMIGEMEWSATGRSDVSLAQLAGHGSFTKVASRRTVSRLREMQSKAYLSKNRILGGKALDFFTKEL